VSKRGKNIAASVPAGELSSLTDGELLELHSSSGNNEYLGALYNRYIPLVYGVCLKYLHNTDDAADAVMNIFEHIVEKVERFQIGEFRTWLYTVTKNHCMQVLRRTSHTSESYDIERHGDETGDITHLLAEGLRESRHKALEKCLEKLPEPQRKSIELFFFAKKSYADISLETRWSQKSVKSYIQNGKRNLKLCIEKQENELD
jgi:RNA polymerase sigma-70 factor (ECF subfamily)